MSNRTDEIVARSIAAAQEAAASIPNIQKAFRTWQKADADLWCGAHVRVAHHQKVVRFVNGKKVERTITIVKNERAATFSLFMHYLGE